MKMILAKPLSSWFKKIQPNPKRHSSQMASNRDPLPSVQPVALGQSLQHLSSEEIKKLAQVLERQEQLEKEEHLYRSKLHRELEAYEQMVHQNATSKHKLKHIDIRLCRLCFKTKFADGIGRICKDCQRRVCSRCGEYSKPKWNKEKNKFMKGRWSCKMCCLRRKIVCSTGQWFHGSDGSSSFDTAQFVKMIKREWWHHATERKVDNPTPAWPRCRLSVQEETNHKTEFVHGQDANKRRNSVPENNWSACQQKPRTDRRFSLQDQTLGMSSSDNSSSDSCNDRKRQRSRLRHKRRAKPRVKVYKNPFNGSYSFKKVDSDESLTEYRSKSLDVPESDPLYSKQRARKSFSEPVQSGKKFDLPRIEMEPLPEDMNALERLSPEGGHPGSDDVHTSPSNSIEHQDSSTGNENWIGRSYSKWLANLDGKDMHAYQDGKLKIAGSPALDSAAERRQHFANKDMIKSHPKQSPFLWLSKKSSSCSSEETLLEALTPTPSPSPSRLKAADGNDAMKPGSEVSNAITTQQDVLSVAIQLLRCKAEIVVLHKDKKNYSCSTLGLGMRITGGKQGTDGFLFASVMRVVPGGPADTEGKLQKGDQIIELNGHSLIDTTFEATTAILQSTGDIIHMLVVRCNNSTSLEYSSQDSVDESSYQVVTNTTATKFYSGNFENQKGAISDAEDSSSPEKHVRRRRLPAIPTNVPPLTLYGKIELQLWYDSTSCVLEVIIFQASDLKRPIQKHISGDRGMPIPFIKLHMVPHRWELPSYTTEVVKASSSPVWNTTFKFENITQSELLKKSLEVTVWDQHPYGEDVFLGEVVLELNALSMDDEPLWHALMPHDENNGTLPFPNTKSKGVHSSMPSTPAKDFIKVSTVSLVPAMPAHEKAKQILKNNKPGKLKEFFRKHLHIPVPQFRSRSIDSSIQDYLSVEDMDNPHCMSSEDEWEQTETDYAIRRQGSAMRSAISCGELTPYSPDMAERRRNRITSLDNAELSRIPSSELSTQRTMEEIKQIARLSVKANKHYAITERLSTGSSSIANRNSVSSQDISDSDVDMYFLDFKQNHPSFNDDDYSKILGYGQIRPENDILAEGIIKLGFLMTKGRLEVEVFCAKGLPITALNETPDTYVKTYLVHSASNRRFKKRKTKIARRTTDPNWKQTIKYSACDVDDRCLQVMIWEKFSGFDKNCCLGEVTVDLARMDLSCHSVDWYKMFRYKEENFGSTESL